MFKFQDQQDQKLIKIDLSLKEIKRQGNDTACKRMNECIKNDARSVTDSLFLILKSNNK